MRLAVFDTIETPQRFNLIKLFGLILNHLGSEGLNWAVHRAEGYGLTITSLDEQLDAAPHISLALEELVVLLLGLNEWLYWFEAVNEDGTVRFGLADSSYMFVEGPAELLDDVRRCFDETSEVPIDRG